MAAGCTWLAGGCLSRRITLHASGPPGTPQWRWPLTAQPLSGVQANGIDQVRIGGDTAGLGTRYYEDPEADSLEESVEVRRNASPDAAYQRAR